MKIIHTEVAGLAGATAPPPHQTRCLQTRRGLFDVDTAPPTPPLLPPHPSAPPFPRQVLKTQGRVSGCVCLHGNGL